MVQDSSLRNHFLIAMPGMGDPNFSRSVTLICEHGDDGALGLMINQPMQLTLDEVLAQMEIPYTNPELGEASVMLGGPVQTERGFVLHGAPGGWDTTIRISDELFVTSSRDILQALAGGRAPARLQMILGYAGWAAGQLEAEMRDNAWLSTPANPGIVFNTPTEQRWNEAARLIGVDLDNLSGQAGHA